MKVTPISISNVGDDEYQFVFINHGLEWLPESDPDHKVTLSIIYRPKCLQDNAINFGLTTDLAQRKQNYLKAVQLLKAQVQDNLGKHMVFGFNARQNPSGTYVTHNLRVHHNTIKNTDIVWTTGTEITEAQCAKRI